ncbi:MAG: AzlC family ABC transporter permease [Lachnospiraceae bacterium]|nr:AzlC family ABC transporter permease [Lachnospiraceae bacterium]
MPSNRKTWFQKGLKDGVPIALGYFAVSFTLGITAKTAGLTALQAMLASLTLNASAGEFAGFTLIAAGASYLEVAIMEFVANARYLLMSCALSQKLSPDTPLWQRLLIGYDVTDEIFGISISVPGRLHPYYTFGAIAIAVPGWSIGTYLGVVMGNILPANVVSALSVGLYGMFIAIIIPPARKSKIVAGVVAISMAASFLFTKLPAISDISSGVRTIILTILISAAAAFLFPIKEEDPDHAA